MVTRAVHYNSARRAYPFIPVNWGAVLDNLIENELFGHAQRAFTALHEPELRVRNEGHAGLEGRRGR
jgi:DNA-binding NtrC family response regulator